MGWHDVRCSTHSVATALMVGFASALVVGLAAPTAAAWSTSDPGEAWAIELGDEAAAATASTHATVDQAVAQREAKVRLAALQEAAKRERDAVWDRMAYCETGGNWSMRGGAYSGGLGIANSTWVAFGGRELAPSAGYATRDEQIVVAERIRVVHGYRAWGCARAIGK